MLFENYLRYNLVESQRMGKRAGTNIWDANHFEYTRHVCVSGLSLDAIRNIKDQARQFAFHDPWHEILEMVNEILISFECLYLMSSPFQAIGDLLYRL